MSTLITLVGQQPAAVAVTARTLLEMDTNHPLERVILLYTKDTKTEAQRLESYLQNLASNLAVEPLFIALDTTTADQNSLAWNIIRQKINGGGLSEPIYYDTSPGLNYQVALISHHLKDEPRIKPLYADFNYLHSLEDGQKWELVDIGLKTLLDLHGLTTQPPVNDSDKEVNNLKIILTPPPPLALLKAVERKGRLHGLVRLWRDSTAVKESENHRLKQECRRVAALLESPHHIMQLRPILTVLSNDTLMLKRAATYGIKGVETADTWEQNLNQPPGQLLPGPEDSELPADKLKESYRCKGDWQDGTGLIVALGADPSATLLALYSHAPQRAIILVDWETPWVKVMAHRLFLIRDYVKCQSMIFWPTNMQGRIEDPEAFGNLLQDGSWELNISPGTKAQSWNLARLPNVRLWSLYNQSQSIQPLVPGPGLCPRNFGFPEIAIQAACVGGRLVSEGISLVEISTKKNFLSNLINVVAKQVKRNPRKRFWPPCWQAGEQIQVDDSNYITCVDVFPSAEKIQFQACNNGNKLEGTVTSFGDFGHWLEEAVAGAFLAAGGKKISDLTVGIRWAWLHPMPQNYFRSEIDIVLQWQGQYIAISCKSTSPPDLDWEAVRNEIVAEARSQLGRFTLPVLIRPGINHNEAIEWAIASIKFEPLEINLSLLNQPNMLKNLVMQALDRRQATL